mgnify:CR=1 FL=1
MYASIGLACRTTEAAQYFVAGRNVPALYNGMAIGADWMSVASFMGLAGLLYANGFGGSAYVLGWTGGFCLIAFFIAPYSAAVRPVHDSRLPGRALRRAGCRARWDCS